MMNNLKRQHQAPMLAALALLAAPLGARAADDILVDNFDTADTAGLWTRWWGCAPQAYEWDATVDANGNANSGSLRATIDFSLAGCGGDNQFALLRSFPLVDGSQYTNLVFDLLWDPSSPQRPGGDFGFMEPGFRNSDFTQNWLPGFTVSTTPGWMRIVLPINPTAPKIESITGIVLKMWSGQAPGLTGRAVFWVDNVRLIARSDTTAPPPTMVIEKAAPGLRIFASAAGSQYQRQSIRTINPGYSWVGGSEPVTYSITIGDYPGSANSSFQTHLFIVPGSSIPTWETSPDWNQPNVVFLDIQNQANGGAYAAFRYKTNLPSGNSMIYGNGTIAGLGATSIRGTWSLTFDPAGPGGITLTAPNGANTNFAMPPDAVTLFSGPAYAYFGIQPNQIANIGQGATFARLQITGVPTPIDDSFSAPTLDTATWEIIAENAAGVVPIPADTAFWLSWTLPDRDFIPQVAEDLSFDPIGWADLPLTASQIGDRRRTLVLQSQLPPNFTGNYFFRMIKRPPAQ